MKPILTIAGILACSLGLSAQALAQTPSDAAPDTPAAAAPTEAQTQAPLLTPDILTERLNASEICTPLTLNINDITSLFGVAIPSYLPIDPTLRWDQNAHTVESFAANEGSFEAVINIGCQPSSNGTLLNFIGLTAEKLRLPGQAFCAGAFGENGELVGNDCTIEGRIVPYVGKTIDLEGRVERGLTTTIPVTSETPN
ncbi:hypothetical protein [Fulvimarina sp. MAC3]|uniref:hypothetical protein n=1 Tax=Fulvimarina sp. MAC3 TaxID=3148887 RepID=UPI0031FC800A